MAFSARPAGALIGCGFFADNHMHGWDTVGAEIVAVCDRDEGRARAMAERFGVPRHYRDARAMLAHEELDFVDIATTVGSHRALVELSAPKTKLVICQKPIAETLADADAMIAACDAADTHLLIHENFRWQRPFIEFRRAVAGGAIGRSVFLRLSFRHGYDIYANQPYLAQVGRLALMDIGLHLVDVARFLVGDIEDVHCRTARINPAVTGEDMFLMTCRHCNDVISSIECSFAARVEPDPFPQTLARIEGTDGTIELLQDFRMRISRPGACEELSVDPPVPDWGGRPWHLVQDSVISLERHAMAVLNGGADPSPSGAHNRETLRAVLDAYASAARSDR